MKILITGATGFIGKNLSEKIETLHEGHIVYKVNSKTSETELKSYLKDCDILYNFAAVHRPLSTEEFRIINVDYLKNILDFLKNNNPGCSVLTMSSIQAGNGSLYGDSKIAAENLIKEYCEETGSTGHVLRLTNCFGKYARPNAHSVVATFCYNISHDLPIRIDDPDAALRLCYIDDVVELLTTYLFDRESSFCYLPEKFIYELTVGKLAESILKIKAKSLTERDEFIGRLEKTYNWYAEQD